MTLRTPSRVLCSVLSGSALALLVACGGGSKSETPPATPDFSLQVTPGSLQIPAGGSGYVTVTLSRLNGFTAAVTLSGAGFPAGVVASGSLASGVNTLQLPVAVAPGVTVASYTGLSIRGQSGALTHDAAFGFTVASALPPSHFRDDLVQAAGGKQVGGTIENHAVARENVRPVLSKDANDTIRLQHGFLPSGSPTDH